MTKLEVLSNVSFKEVITSVELVDLTGDGTQEVVTTSINGDIRALSYDQSKKKPLKEIAHLDGLPPLAALGVGDILGNGIPDLVVGGLDNAVRVISFLDGEFKASAVTPVGSLPTAIGVFNVLNDSSSEVIIATADRNLRCYGWYDVVLDKLAHRVLDKPTFSIQPLVTKGMPYSRFVFGDETGYLYIFQYADDRLHERGRVSVGGEVGLVATGDVTGNGSSEIMVVSDGRVLGLYGFVKGSLEKLDSVRAPNDVTSLRVGQFWKLDVPKGQLVVSHKNSKLTLLNFIGKLIGEEASIKTARRATESMISVGNIDGGSGPRIVQGVGNSLNVIGVDDELV
ncbi:hypothetical protein EU545_00830 [Candidatus Thorarchaeota archaeon]|nr:MAG: hypothetical protein EU545_00830 [Candidatus Thorarchaeota archaeon]